MKSRNVTHFICAAVKSPAVLGAIDLTSYYRGAEAGGSHQEHDTDNRGSLSLSLLLLFHCLSLHIILPSPNPPALFLVSPLMSFFPLFASFSFYLCPQMLTYAYSVADSEILILTVTDKFQYIRVSLQYSIMTFYFLPQVQ